MSTVNKIRALRIWMNGHPVDIVGDDLTATLMGPTAHQQLDVYDEGFQVALFLPGEWEAYEVLSYFQEEKTDDAA